MNEFKPKASPNCLIWSAEKDHPDAPWGVLSGDSLFVSSAGRPDLLGNAQAKKLAEKLFHLLHDFYLRLDNGVIVYPDHGAGSSRGADIGDRLSSTIGHERRFNAFLQYENVKAFIDYALSTAPPMWEARFGDSIALRAVIGFGGGMLMAFGSHTALEYRE